jgi:general secretion pathway protein C
VRSVRKRGGAAAAETEAAAQAVISERELDAGIASEGGTRFTVQRSLVERVLQHQELWWAVRAVLHRENGRALGVKLYGIGQRSLLGKLGLQNGDLLRAINGYPLTSPDEGLDAYVALRGATRLTVALERQGRALRLDYAIRNGASSP